MITDVLICGFSLAEADQREVAERRHRRAFDQFHAQGPLHPVRITRPCELAAPAEAVDDRRQQMFDHLAKSAVGADPAQQDDLAAGLEHPDELVERRLGIGDRRDDILRHHDIERALRKIQLLRVHDGEALDVLQTQFGDLRLRLAQHGGRDVDAEDAAVGAVQRKRDAGADTDLEHPAADLVRGADGGAPSFGEHRAEHQIIEGGPAVVGALDHVGVEYQLLRRVRFCDL